MTPSHDRPAGRVLHAGPAIVDVSLRVPAVPAPGSDTYAHDALVTAGGGTNVMVAAARAGADVTYLGMRGDGQFSRVVDNALAAEGIMLPGEVIPGVDVGWCVAMVDDRAERTFVSVRGCEALDNSASLRSVEPGPGDAVYVIGYSVLAPGSRGALAAWLPGLTTGVHLLVDPSPLVADLPADGLALLRRHATVWSLGHDEALALAPRLDLAPADDPAALAAQLAAALPSAVVLRHGAAGCWLATPGDAVVHVPAPVVEAVDTTGAGDTHAGVVLAGLAAGVPLVDAVRRATVAAALSVTRRGPATAPVAAELDAVLRDSSRAAAGRLG